MIWVASPAMVSGAFDLDDDAILAQLSSEPGLLMGDDTGGQQPDAPAGVSAEYEQLTLRGQLLSKNYGTGKSPLTADFSTEARQASALLFNPDNCTDMTIRPQMVHINVSCKPCKGLNAKHLGGRQLCVGWSPPFGGGRTRPRRHLAFSPLLFRQAIRVRQVDAHSGPRRQFISDASTTRRSIAAAFGTILASCPELNEMRPISAHSLTIQINRTHLYTRSNQRPPWVGGIVQHRVGP